ncbi:MAG: CRISPR-associated endonuclease Cas2 [Candidatus Moranbacteria bacterium]|nr:CRISPR-associated endonuclease Cas2 [Candidatus Moranbacteria bacterium]
MLKRIGPVQQKILAAIIGGVGLAFSSSPTQSFSMVRAVGKEWKRIDQNNLRRSVRSLCQSKLLVEKRRRDGTVVLELTEEGKRQARYWSIFGKGIKVAKPKQWDRLWRVVMFDIPEKKRRFRDILRDHLKEIGFKELQHSVFVFPYPCETEIAALADLYGAKEYVRILTVKKIDNGDALEKKYLGSRKK